MSEIKLYLRNKTRAELTFSVSNDVSVTIPPHGSRIVSAEKGIRPFVSSHGLAGDIWQYEINEDTSLDCSLVGEELQLRIGSPIP